MTAVVPVTQHIVVVRPQYASRSSRGKSLVLNSLRLPHTRRSYDRALAGRAAGDLEQIQLLLDMFRFKTPEIL
jgi:hypothetical protein